MQIVINISDSLYNRLIEMNSDSDTCSFNESALVESIQNGTPLPKGHGRLIDEDELLKMTKNYKSELGRLKADPFVKCGIETVESFIRERQTIIEADKEKEDE